MSDIEEQGETTIAQEQVEEPKLEEVEAPQEVQEQEQEVETQEDENTEVEVQQDDEAQEQASEEVVTEPESSQDTLTPQPETPLLESELIAASPLKSVGDSETYNSQSIKINETLIEKQKGIISTYKEDISEKDELIDRLNDSNTNLNKNIDVLRDKLKDKDIILAELNLKISQVDKEIRAVKESEYEVLNQNRTLTGELTNIAKEVENLEATILEKDDLIEDLRRQLAQKSNENDNFVKNIEEFQE